MPCVDPSRPMPLSLTPPNGATSVVMRPSLMPTMPLWSARETRKGEIAAVKIGGQSEFGRVGRVNGFLLVLEAEQCSTGPNVSSCAMSMSDAAPVMTVGL